MPNYQIAALDTCVCLLRGVMYSVRVVFISFYYVIGLKWMAVHSRYVSAVIADWTLKPMMNLTFIRVKEKCKRIIIIITQRKIQTKWINVFDVPVELRFLLLVLLFLCVPFSFQSGKSKRFLLLAPLNRCKHIKCTARNFVFIFRALIYWCVFSIEMKYVCARVRACVCLSAEQSSADERSTFFLSTFQYFL